MIWYFREAPIDGARTGGQAAEFAFEHSLKSLAPETAQNANDEKLDTETSVDLAYTVIELTGASLESFLSALKFEELRPHYEAIIKERPDLPISGSIRRGLEQIDQSRLLLLRIADAGTTGLIGPEANGENFAAVMRDTLSSTKDGSKGGSYGLGKATMWASSLLGLVLANSDLSEPFEGKSSDRLIGRLELPSRNVGTDGFDGPGWFGVEGDRGAESMWENRTAAADLLLDRGSKNIEGRTGTSFLVVGVHDGSGEAETPEAIAEKLEEELVERFWPAMIPDANGATRLRVRIAVERNGHTDRDQAVDAAARRPIEVAMMEQFHAGDFGSQLTDDGDLAVAAATFTVPQCVGTIGPHPETDHEVVILITQLDQRETDQVDQVHFMRGSRMVVESTRAKGLAVGHRPFRAIVLAGTASDGESDAAELAERFLRRAEPPEHNKWTHLTRRVSAEYQYAHKRLKGFRASANRAIADIVNRPVKAQDNGPDSLRELLKISDTSQPKAKEPRISGVTLERIDEDGAWVLSAKITAPGPRSGCAWKVTPVARFGVESGAPYGVTLKSIEAVRQCEVVDHQILIKPTARTATIRITTDPTSHPTLTKYATAGVDIQRPEEVAAS